MCNLPLKSGGAILKTEIELRKESYIGFLRSVKEDIHKSQLSAATTVTKELVALYWRIGKRLSEKVQNEGWGGKVFEKISCDIARLFPGLKGFSKRNLQYMRKFHEFYPNGICATAVAQIPWGHNMLLLNDSLSNSAKLWYANQTLENGWSRNVLSHWIDSDLYARQGEAITNFQETLPAPQSDLAEQVLKDPYNFGFLGLDQKYREEELEKGLTDHIQQFLVELGQGFAFVGRQKTITVGDSEYSIDLLFYHLKLRCYVVIELKAGKFDPRDAGQMSFYLSAVDDLMRHEDDQPTIGMLLCKTKEKMVVEYALRGNQKPIGVASYETQITESLPEEFKGSLPTIEEIEAEFGASLESVLH